MLKGPLTPDRKKAEVFGDFGHRPMPHSVVVNICCSFGFLVCMFVSIIPCVQLLEIANMVVFIKIANMVSKKLCIKLYIYLCFYVVTAERLMF